jgi:hypothetical protein
MANYSHIHLAEPTTPEELEERLKEAVLMWFNGRAQVITAPWEHQNPTWLVYIPGTAQSDEKKALHSMLAPGEDVGFPVELEGEGRTIALRHSPNMCETWMRGCIEEMLSEVYGVGVFYDATDRLAPPGSREYRRGRRLFDYLSRNFKRPLTKEDIAYLSRYRTGCPAGFWGGPGGEPTPG